MDLERPGWPWLGLAHLGSDRSGNIVAHGGLEVCDAAHGWFVMKKGWNLAHPFAAESHSSQSARRVGHRAPGLTTSAILPILIGRTA
jgi:hypothetical protein